MPQEGTFESFEGTFRIKQIVAQQCSELALLVDHSKFGQKALSKVLDPSDIDVVVTDDKAPDGDVAWLRDEGKTVHVVSVETPAEGVKA